MRPVLIGFLLLVGIILYFSQSTAQIVLTRNQDVLSAPNLISYINLLRAQKGLPDFIEDTSLTQKAKTMGMKGERFDTLNIDYYSTQVFITGWRGKESIFHGKRIGVWVTYYIFNTGTKPVPYVAILIE